MAKLKVYIYGAGKEYNVFSSYYSLLFEQIEILGIVTTKKQEFSSLDGIPCITLEEMHADIMDYVIVAVEQWQEIRDLLIKKGVRCSQIIPSKVFKNPCFSLRDYLELKNKDVSIISNNCIGGMIYHELGMEFMSPTINIRCSGRDYLEFLKKYEFYLGQDMKVFRQAFEYPYNPANMGREQFYPKGIIDNKLVWWFVHSDNAETSVNEWNVRRKRVNLNNIVAIMLIMSDEEAYEFDKLNIERKIGIYYKDLQLDSVIYCKEWDNNPQLWLENNFNWNAYAVKYMTNTQGKNSRINWIKFLNGATDYIRY